MEETSEANHVTALQNRCMFLVYDKAITEVWPRFTDCRKLLHSKLEPDWSPWNPFDLESAQG